MLQLKLFIGSSSKYILDIFGWTIDKKQMDVIYAEKSHIWNIIKL